MIKLIVVAIILIVIMLVFVFILFKNIIRRIDDNAKKYFVNKMQNYDYILEEKQTKLEELKTELKEIEEEHKNLVQDEEESILDFAPNHEKEEYRGEPNFSEIKYNLNVPEFRESLFFNNYKEVRKVFTVNNEQIIKDFIQEHKNSKEETEYKRLKKVREKFDEKSIYECLTLDIEEQKQLLSEILTAPEKKLVNFDSLIQDEDFDINYFIEILDSRLAQIEPTIYIYVNGLSNNYEQLDPNIVIKQYSNMSEGIIIKYRNKIYDYSI